MTINNSLIALGLFSALGLNTAMASEKLSIDEVGHLSYTQTGQVQKKVATATTVISRYSQDKAVVQVSQVFANDSQESINAEYLFPTPENGDLINFIMFSNYELTESIPEKAITLDQGNTLTVAYQYELDKDSNYHSSLVGYPQANEKTKETLVAKK